MVASVTGVRPSTACAMLTTTWSLRSESQASSTPRLPTIRSPLSEGVGGLVVVRGADHDVVHVEALRGHPLTNLLDVVIEEAHDIKRYERHGGVALPKHDGARPDVVVDAVGRSSVLESREPCRLKLAIGLALVGPGIALVPFAELIASAVEEGLRGLVPLGVALALVGLNPGLVVGTGCRLDRSRATARSRSA